jgi:hypothetical protein
MHLLTAESAMVEKPGKKKAPPTPADELLSLAMMG